MDIGEGTRMHTEKQVIDIATTLGHVLALGTQGLTGYAQAALETDAIAVYLSTQIATLKDEVEREQAMADINTHLRIAVEARMASRDPAKTLVSPNDD